MVNKGELVEREKKQVSKVEVIRQCIEVIRQCVGVIRQWLELRRLLLLRG